MVQHAVTTMLKKIIAFRLNPVKKQPRCMVWEWVNTNNVYQDPPSEQKLCAVLNSFFQIASPDGATTREFCELAQSTNLHVFRSSVRTLTNRIAESAVPNPLYISALVVFLTDSTPGMLTGELVVGAATTLIAKLDPKTLHCDLSTRDHITDLIEAVEVCFFKMIDLGINKFAKNGLYTKFAPVLNDLKHVNYYPIAFHAENAWGNLTQINHDETDWQRRQKAGWLILNGLVKIAGSVGSIDVDKLCHGSSALIKAIAVLLNVPENLSDIWQAIKLLKGNNSDSINVRLNHIKLVLSLAVASNEEARCEEALIQIKDIYHSHRNERLLFGIVEQLGTMRLYGTDTAKTFTENILKEIRENHDEWGLTTNCITDKKNLPEFIQVEINYQLSRSLSKDRQVKLWEPRNILATPLLTQSNPSFDEGPLNDHALQQVYKEFVYRIHSLKSIDEDIQTPPNRGSVRGAFSGRWCLKPHVYPMLFNSDGDVIRNCSNGVRDVARVEAEGHVFYFKHNPEFPDMELAINQLGLILFGDAILHEVVQIYVEHQGCFSWKTFTVSEGINGQEFAQKLQWGETLTKSEKDQLSKNLTQSIDLASFGRQSIMAMLCRFQDQKCDNLFLCKDGSIAAIDNERAFIADTEKSNYFFWKKSSIQSFLFCMDLMQVPFDSNVISAITTWKNNNDPEYTLVQRWLEQLHKIKGTCERTFVNNSMHFKLQPAVVWNLIHGLREVLQITTDHISTPEHLLERLLPNATSIYRNALNYGGNLEERFEIATEFSRGQLKTSVSRLDIIRNQVKAAPGTNRYNRAGSLNLEIPQQPFELLKLLSLLKNTQVKEVLTLLHSTHLNDTQWTKLEAFIAKLHETKSLNFMLKKIDFSIGILKEASDFKKFMDILQCFSHEELTIQHSKHLTNETLAAVIQNSPKLLELKLVDCSQVTTLPVNYLSSLTRLELEEMPQIKDLNLKSCTALKHIEICLITSLYGLTPPSQLRQVLLPKSCLSLDMGYSWNTEMGLIELGKAEQLYWENVAGMKFFSDDRINSSVLDIYKGEFFGFESAHTTHDMERILEQVDWDKIPHNLRENWIETIGRYALHQLWITNGSWIQDVHYQTLIKNSPFLRKLHLRNTPIPQCPVPCEIVRLD